MSSRIRKIMAGHARLLTAGALAAGLALAAAGPATAASRALPAGSTIPLGDGYMGVGYVQDAKQFTPDTRQVTAATLTPNA